MQNWQNPKKPRQRQSFVDMEDGIRSHPKENSLSLSSLNVIFPSTVSVLVVVTVVVVVVVVVMVVVVVVVAVVILVAVVAVVVCSVLYNTFSIQIIVPVRSGAFRPVFGMLDGGF